MTNSNLETVLKLEVRYLILLGICFLLFGISSSAHGAAPVFYSVGQTTDDLKTCTDGDCGTNPLTVTLSSGEATFSVAQTGNIGVGDVITYDTSQTCYISSKTSTSVWNCVSATGTVPADITDSTVVSIKRVFTSLSSAETGAEALLGTSDLVTGNYQLNFPCYYDTGADTTAVTIDGWTTGADNFIKVYTPNNTATEANFSQRHEGVWDEGKYWLNVSGNGMSNANYYTVINGLQIKSTGTAINSTRSNSILNCILVVIGNNPSSSINHQVAGSAYIFNNVLVNNSSYAHSNTSCITNTKSGTTVSASNNSCSSILNGFVATYGYIVAKNNISQNSVNPFIFYSGTFSSASTHNLTDDSPENGAFGATYSTGTTTATTANKLTDSGATFISDGVQTGSIVKNTTDTTYSYVISVDSETELTLNDDIFTSGEAYNVYTNMYGEAVFEDGDNDDFRLSPDDTVAKDKGADLSADANLAFDYDIASSSRPTGEGWDIGAHEAPVRIFRSVGPSATAALDDDNSGADTVTISSITSTAVFSAAVADNVGVGDAVLIDTGGTDQTIDSADTLLFISGRTSSTGYTLQTETGALPSDIALNDTWEIYRAHTSLSNAEAGTVNSTLSGLGFTFTGGNRDLVTNNEQWNIACYANGTTADTAAVSVSGWTTADVNYIKIYTPTETTEVGTSQRHSGKWDENKYLMDTVTKPIVINDNYLWADGLQLYSSETGIPGGSISAVSLAISASFKFSNLILKGAGGNNAGLYIDNQNADVEVWNNIAYDFSYNGGSAAGIRIAQANFAKIYNNTVRNSRYGIRVNDEVTGTIIVKNNISSTYTGSFHADSTHNLSSDATAPGSNPITGATVQFVDADNDDFHLSPNDTTAKDAGTDLSADEFLPFDTDIDGETRGVWDIGADEMTKSQYKLEGGFQLEGDIRFE